MGFGGTPGTVTQVLQDDRLHHPAGGNDPGRHRREPRDRAEFRRTAPRWLPVTTATRPPTTATPTTSRRPAPASRSTSTRPSPRISTIVKDGQGNTVDNGANKAALGTVVHDTSTLSGQVGSFSFDSGATVTYKFYKTNDCTSTAGRHQPGREPGRPGDGAQLGRQRRAGCRRLQLPGHLQRQRQLQVGDGRLRAVQRRPGPAQDHHDRQGRPGQHRRQRANKAALGTVVHDTATLSGQVGSFSFNGGATVTYKFFKTNDCTGPPAATSQDVNLVAPATVPDSADSAALAPGDYSYQATYNGNANYKSATGDCEPFHVNQAQPGITTTVKDARATPSTTAPTRPLSARSCTTPRPSRARSAAFSFDGGATVTYRFFKTNDCTGTAGRDQPGRERSPRRRCPTRPTAPTLAAGDYSYQATYNGNANYKSATGACEPFNVAQAPARDLARREGQPGQHRRQRANPAALGNVRARHGDALRPGRHLQLQRHRDRDLHVLQEQRLHRPAGRHQPGREPGRPGDRAQLGRQRRAGRR